MAYLVYLDEVLLPVTPSKIQMKISNNNQTMSLIDESQINVLKSPGLTDIEFDMLLPNVKYPFASYENEFKGAYYYLEKLKTLKTGKKSFLFVVTRETPSGKNLFNTNMEVSIEDYTIKEDAKQGFDVVVSIKLRQYISYQTKICEVSYENEVASITVEEVREQASSPIVDTVTTYTVVSGDTLWTISKKLYGDGSKYTVIANANTDKVKNVNLIYPGQVLTIPSI